jgi:hypothetical protein
MNNKVKIGAISVVVLLVIGVIGFYLFGDNKKSIPGNESKNTVKTESGETVSYSDSYQGLLDKEYDKANSDKKFEYKQDDIYNLVHWISNPVIKAKGNQKIGLIEPTPENIDKLITILEKTPIAHQDFFIKSLKEWKKGDFVDVKDVHNTAWKMLDGNIGKAKSPDDFAINNLKEKYYK